VDGQQIGVPQLEGWAWGLRTPQQGCYDILREGRRNWIVI